jgi:hypothetical protein
MSSLRTCAYTISITYPGELRLAGKIARGLKPGGLAVISDFRHTREYGHAFSKLGLDIHSFPISLDTFPSLRINTARKQP